VSESVRSRESGSAQSGQGASARSGEKGPLQTIAQFDRLLEHRLRLALMVLLSQFDALSFVRLKQMTGETDGNLAGKLRRLEEAGYITVRKEFQDRRPITWYALSDGGRQALSSHLAALADLVQQVAD
jgi:DNA-binding PadR family transcriptional regulator